jgi:Lar family restriction alleviation protein
MEDMELLPCPFCGAQPRIDKSRITEGYSIHCPECDACGGWQEGNTADLTIAAWNTRKTDNTRMSLLEAQRKQHRAKHKSYKRRFRIAPYRVQDWLLREHSLLVSMMQVEEAMNTPLADEKGLPGPEADSAV